MLFFCARFPECDNRDVLLLGRLLVDSKGVPACLPSTGAAPARTQIFPGALTVRRNAVAPSALLFGDNTTQNHSAIAAEAYRLNGRSAAPESFTHRDPLRKRPLASPVRHGLPRRRSKLFFPIARAPPPMSLNRPEGGTRYGTTAKLLQLTLRTKMNFSQTETDLLESALAEYLRLARENPPGILIPSRSRVPEEKAWRIEEYAVLLEKLRGASFDDFPEAPCCDAETARRALRRLVVVARHDTGQSARAAAFILAWYNPGAWGKWDILDIWGMDADLREDMLTLLRYLAHHRGRYPSDIVGDDEIRAIIKQWHPKKYRAIFKDDSN